MAIVLTIVIGFVICWLSLIFERCYKFHQEILYKVHLSDKQEFVSSDADELINELDEMFPKNID